MYPNGYNIYKSNSVKLASKEQILLMLVEGAVRFCKIGRQAIIEGNIQKAHDALTRTQDIFVELMVTLDREAGEWAIQLFKIYEFISDKIGEANMKKSVEIVDEILPLIEDISDLWHKAEAKSKQ